jgi:O-antigen ligase
MVAARWSEIFTEIGIYLALIGLLLRPADLRFPPPLRWATAFLLWACVTALFAISPDIAGQALIERLKTLVIFFVVINVLRKPQQLRFYLLLILFAFLIYPARGTLLNYLRGETLQGRALWNKIYSNPNELASITLLMLGVSLAIAAVKTQNARVRRMVFAFVPVLLTIVLLTQSRGAFIGLLFGFGPPLLARIRKLPRVAAPVLVVFFVIASLVPAAAWHRLGGITKLTSSTAIAHADSSAAQRFQILKIGLHIAATHPVLGVGIGCYNEANMRYAPELGSRDAHSTYVGLAAETGVPGLLLWLGLVGSVLAEVRRRRASLEANNRTIELLWIKSGVIGYLIEGLFGTYSGLTVFYLFLGILWAGANMLGRGASARAVVPTERRASRAGAGRYAWALR